MFDYCILKHESFEYKRDRLKTLKVNTVRGPVKGVFLLAECSGGMRTTSMLPPDMASTKVVSPLLSRKLLAFVT